MSWVDHLVVIHSKSDEGAFRGMIPKASRENGISPATESLYSMQKLCSEPGRKAAIPCRNAASQRQGSSWAGAEAVLWEGSSWKCCSVSWALNPIPHCWAWLHLYFKEIQPHVFYFLPELIDQSFKSRRRDYRSGYPPRLFQEVAEAGSDMKVSKLNQPFLSALLHLAHSVHPGHQPVLLTSTQGVSGQQSWGWDHWECGFWLCSLSLGWNTSIPCLPP